jgi:hypothetical protein
MTTNEKAPGACNTEGLTTQTTALDFATDARFGKALETLIAQLAMRGHAVHQLKDGGFMVCKYGYSHHAPDFDALEAFSRRLGVVQ